MFYLGLPSEKEQAFTTGRIFYLLASGRPLLAAVPWESEIANLVRESSNGFCFSDDTLPDATSFVASQADAWLGGEVEITLLPDYAQKYSSETMAEKFAHLLKSIKDSAKNS